MLEKILKLYVMAMASGVRSPIPHLEGPPGCGKSTAVEMAAEMLGVNLHIINVSRLSPLEIEGVQMPHTIDEKMILKMLPATFWTALEKGDIVLFDEFLRGFPEVYNGLLEIFTSRRVGAFYLPDVFIIAASNSAATYDPALEDRILHLPVPDPRTNKAEKKHLAQIIVDALGLLPEMVTSTEMVSLLDTEVLPMYQILDQFKGKGSTGSKLDGHSVRNLIGQAQLREVQSAALKELLDMNNHHACNKSKWQYVLLPNGKNPNVNYQERSKQLPKDKLTPVQLLNLELNHQLLELEAARLEKEGTTADDDDIFDPPF
jgi:hypothetical protein